MSLISLVRVNVSVEAESGWKCIVQLDQRRQQGINVRRQVEVVVVLDHCEMTRHDHGD